MLSPKISQKVYTKLDNLTYKTFKKMSSSVNYKPASTPPDYNQGHLKGTLLAFNVMEKIDRGIDFIFKPMTKLAEKIANKIYK